MTCVTYGSCCSAAAAAAAGRCSPSRTRVSAHRIRSRREYSIFVALGYSTQSYCLDELESTSIALECPAQQLIKLGRIIYGYSWSNDCSYIDRDCTMDVPREDILCASTSNCTVHVVDHPLILQDCWNLAASYVQAEYECIAGRSEQTARPSSERRTSRLDYSIQNICQQQDVIQSHGFLSTPSYPGGFASNLNCPCSLIATPGHSVVLEIVDFRLPTCAEAGLILWFGQDFQTKCLAHNPVILIGHVDQNVTLRFYSLKHISQGGFLMKYAVSPESDNATVRLQCFAATTAPRAGITTKTLPTAPASSFQPEIHPKVLVSDSNDLLRRLQPAASAVAAQKVSYVHTSVDLLNCGACSRTRSVWPNNRRRSCTISRRTNDVSSARSDVQPVDASSRVDSLPDPQPVPRLNMTLIVIFIVAVVVFLIVINVLIWFICSSQ